MHTSLDLGVTTLFRDATKQNLMSSLKTTSDWERFKQIDRNARAAEQQEKDTFDRDKADLLAKAREELINEAGSKTFEHPTPLGTDRFNKTTIDAEARRRVEQAHETRLIKIREDEGLAYAKLKQDIRAREQARELPSNEFNRVNDRRDGQDRRMQRQ
ncbi:hypothetical protein [Tateyamaria sp. ANG-S1]|uniref:hypothetical protein n=1 Tax=Tateyamaria sp. ANG-S1 TaxID=1577905 RepID=UPI00057C4A81|nr:hypothetical protein [Tateyamaria sp. ANG-S1]KIC51052.1 hypothetical protein RA29_04010 [Tateyamaria sp. ANG-S1]